MTENSPKPSRLLRLYSAVSSRTQALVTRQRPPSAISASDQFSSSTVPVAVPLDRPKGLLVWFHAATYEEVGAVGWMGQRLSRAMGEPVSVLITTRDAQSSLTLAENGSLVIKIPIDSPTEVADFLDHWRPDAGVVAGGDYRPTLLSQASDRGIGLISVNATVRKGTSPQRLKQALVASCSSYFKYTHETDGTVSRALTAEQKAISRVERGEAILESPIVPPVNETDRDGLSRLVSTRPVWLASNLTRGEVGPILAAHSMIAKHTHRALLIASTTDPDVAEALLQRSQSLDWGVARRSLGQEPDADVQFFVADAEGEDGLWYRLASVSFLGNSLAAPGGGISPFPAAALGSVVLHGPHVARHAQRYDRLSRAGAARLVLTGEGLSREVQTFFQPDRAAQSAQAAWSELSLGAVQADKAIEVICDILDGAEGI